MSGRPPTPASLTRLVAERIEVGDVADARAILAEALGLDPTFEQTWLWFAHIAENPGARRFALEQALAANPESSSRQELASSATSRPSSLRKSPISFFRNHPCLPPSDLRSG